MIYVVTHFKHFIQLNSLGILQLALAGSELPFVSFKVWPVISRGERLQSPAIIGTIWKDWFTNFSKKELLSAKTNSRIVHFIPEKWFVDFCQMKRNNSTNATEAIIYLLSEQLLVLHFNIILSSHWNVTAKLSLIWDGSRKCRKHLRFSLD